MTVTFVGVRHHSPACARVVEAVIRRVRPRSVLVEGPADMNGRLGELLLNHDLPVAVFSYLAVEGGHGWRSWTPLCEWSPEHVALRVGADVGADVRFMDLPGWTRPFAAVENRYADAAPRLSATLPAVCARLGFDHFDPLWDHLFEQGDADVHRLAAFFAELRADSPPSAEDVEREAYMARWVAWGAARGDVVVVCGGWHAPWLARAHRDADPTEPPLPAVPEGARGGSYLVPYSDHRMDAFTGYQAGMPSPAWYRAVWQTGPSSVAAHFLPAVVARLRQRGRRVSAGDAVAVELAATAAAALRGHAVITRTDLLDGLASALLDEGLDAPLPWTRDGRVQVGSHPLLVEILATLCGNRVGKLHPATPRPPLVADVAAERAAHRLDGVDGRGVKLDLLDATDLQRSFRAHRLRVLDLPGVRWLGGPDDAVEENWALWPSLDAEARLIECARLGGTLESAAIGALAERAAEAGGAIGVVASVVIDAVRVGVPELSARLIDDLRSAVAASSDLEQLGAALGALLAAWRHDGVRGGRGAPALGGVIEASFARGLWLVEAAGGATEPASTARIEATRALRDTLRFAGQLAVDRQAGLDAMRRRASDVSAPPDLRGAALGFLWSLGELADDDGERFAVDALRGAEPARWGDQLAGLFALAREETLRSGGVLDALDAGLVALDDTDFLVALPALRLAFSWFPPREREVLAEALLHRHGGVGVTAGAWLEAPVDAAVVARGAALDREVSALVARWWGASDPG